MLRIKRYPSLNSTQDKAKKILKDRLVIVSETQEKGRGRFGRYWSSGKGGLWFSVVLKVKDHNNIQYLTFISAIAARKAIFKVCRIDTLIKWPNDLLCIGKKVCGILTETALGKENYAVIGVGMNVNNKIPNNLKKIAVSLKDITKAEINKNRILNSFLSEFSKLYRIYRKKDFSRIRHEWERYSCMLNRKVKARTLGRTYAGISKGIDKDGNLVLRCRGKDIKIVEGDIFFI